MSHFPAATGLIFDSTDFVFLFRFAAVQLRAEYVFIYIVTNHCEPEDVSTRGLCLEAWLTLAGVTSWLQATRMERDLSAVAVWRQRRFCHSQR